MINFDLQLNVEAAVLEPVLYLALVSAAGARPGIYAIHVDLVTQAYPRVVTYSVVQVDVVTAIVVLPIDAHVMITGLVPHATLIYVTLHVEMAEPVPQLLASIVTSVFALLILGDLTVVHPFVVLHALPQEALAS
jgi:hypothetical protein